LTAQKLHHVRGRYLERVILVADRGLLSLDNIDEWHLTVRNLDGTPR
jgi:hypothetical protein